MIGPTGRKLAATCHVCLAPHKVRGDGRMHGHTAYGQPCLGSHEFPLPQPTRMSAEAFMAQYGPGGALADV